MTFSPGRPIRLAAVILMMMAFAACSGGDPSGDDHGPATATAFSLPADGEMPGWSLVTEPEYYEADNLWEYINGQADFFIDYGFVRVDTAEYRNDQESNSVVLEVYRMGRPQEAFGIFAAERTPDDRPLDVGAMAYLGANVLGFWQAELYVKLTSFDEGPAVEQLLIGLAEKISSRLPNQGHELETLLLFPEDGRVGASERFIPRNFLGQPYLSDAYRVGYTFDGQKIQLFVVDTGSPKEAQSHFKRLEDFYRARDQTKVILETTEDPPMLIVDGPSKIVVFQLDHRLGGAIGLQSLDAGRAAAAALAEKMSPSRAPSNPPATAICGGGQGSLAIGHSLATVRHKPRSGAVRTRLHGPWKCRRVLQGPPHRVSISPGWSANLNESETHVLIFSRGFI